MAQKAEPWRVVKTTRPIFELLDIVRNQQQVSVAEVAAKVDMARSTVHNHLKTLEFEGFVVKEGDQYRLSLEFLRYGCTARNAVS